MEKSGFHFFALYITLFCNTVDILYKKIKTPFLMYFCYVHHFFISIVILFFQNKQIISLSIDWKNNILKVTHMPFNAKCDRASQDTSLKSNENFTMSLY